MSQFVLNGIQFTADNSTLKTAGAKTVKFGITDNGNFSDAATDGVETFVNAVEIDWNGAQLKNGSADLTVEGIIKIVAKIAMLTLV